MLMHRTPALRGMTLVELMVTLAVASVLMFAVMPSIGAWMRNTQIRNVTETVVNGLQRARNEAVRRNQPVRFSLVALTDAAVMDNSCAASSTAGSWVVSLADPAGLCATAASDTVAPFIIDSHPVADGGRNTVITALQADGVTAANSVTFDGFGRIASAAAITRIDINTNVTSADYRPLRITLTPGGSVRSCDPKVSSTTDPRHC
ncbi:MAG TPA: GspH/FimT family pseudopilin [Albitalea sp.]|uniref:GspH/FimT family pseudopilin n=1 Tax=Piscinibacter sp. TaxID=1903157 RepID=UPI002ED6589B